MEYNTAEQEVLDVLNRTDFSNMKKNEIVDLVVSYKSLISEMRPEVVKDVIKQYPQLVSLLKNAMNEEKAIVEKGIESNSKGNKEFIDACNKVINDLSMCLERNNLSEESIKDITDKEIKILEMAYDKDTETKELNWRLVGIGSLAVFALVAVGASALGGKFDIKLPNKLLKK